MNKYQKTPDITLDLHGLTVSEARKRLLQLVSDSANKGNHVRIITGKGNHSAGGVAKIQLEVKDFLNRQGISWKYGKVNEGGEGVIEFAM
jgi:DNA-nicking Smr family endonuclease